MDSDSPVILIRHAESAAQKGSASSDVSLIPITENGRIKAVQLASQLLEPDLIVISPFIRTRQTAQPLIDLYPGVPVEEWPVQEPIGVALGMLIVLESEDFKRFKSAGNYASYCRAVKS